jgi:hypothetical protein
VKLILGCFRDLFDHNKMFMHKVGENRRPDSEPVYRKEACEDFITTVLNTYDRVCELRRVGVVCPNTAHLSGGKKNLLWLLSIKELNNLLCAC